MYYIYPERMKINHLLKIKLLTFCCFLLFLSFNNKALNKCLYSETPRFQVAIKHFYSSEGEMLNWFISKDSLKIHYNCDFEDCKDTLIYQSAIDSNIIKTYFNEIVKIPLDQLKSKYDREAMSDGLMENIDIKNVFNKDISIYIHGIEVPEIDALYRITDSLILNQSKFKIINY